MTKRPTSGPRASTLRAAFTLTEVMIALAIVALLLIGISRIFALTSQTISAGQALAKAMRAQRAIHQVLSADFNGVGALPGNVDSNTGMVPLGGGSGKSAPFLIISNFRVAAYANEADALGDVNPPVAGDSFQVRSAKIRTMDLNGNGVDTDTGETIPIFQTGQRNWRVDSIGFFTQGNFKSQTGTTISTGNTQYDFSKVQNDLTASNAFTWYGHLAVFNGDAARIPWRNAYGFPGMELTPDSQSGTPTPKGELPNRNNMYANDFLLGRFQMLLIEPTDHDNNPATEATVVTSDLTPVAFVYHAWNSPTQADTSRPPLTFGSAVRAFNYAASPRDNYNVGQNDQLYIKSVTPPEPAFALENSRTDIAGVGMKSYYERLAFLGKTRISATADVRDTWWDSTSARFTSRYWINPFAREATGSPFSSRTYSQRSQLLSAGCPQFIVEFAGDFVTQNADGVVQAPVAAGASVHAFNPDGMIDFVVLNGRREVRWYGMPRDVDGNGRIPGNATNNPITSVTATNLYSSPDVIPLRDMTGGRMEIEMPATTPPTPAQWFEVACPIAAADYAQVFDEVANPNTTPITNSTPFLAAIDPEDSGYICAWNPIDFEMQKPISAAADAKLVRPVPQLIRVIVDARDPEGKLNEPVREEYVFPVPVSP